MTSGHRIPQDGRDVISDHSRRIIALERRRGVSNIEAYVGNGIAPYARLITDWNDVSLLQNGWYMSDILTVNSPDETKQFLGHVVVARSGHGIMEVWEHSDGLGTPSKFTRQFHYHNPPTLPEFSPWVMATGTTSWVTPILGNGWIAYGVPHQPVRYCIHNGMTLLLGAMKNGITGTTVFLLPPTFRPSSIAIETNLDGTWEVLPNGNVNFYGAGNTIARVNMQFLAEL